MRPNIPDYKPSDKASAKKLNTMLAELRRLSRTSTVPPIEAAWGAGGLSLHNSFNRIVWARLTNYREIYDDEGHDVGEYEGIQQREKEKGNWEDDPVGFRWTFAQNPLYEINNGNFVPVVGVNDIVAVFMGFRNPQKPEWLFIAPSGGKPNGWWSRLIARDDEAYSHIHVERPCFECKWVEQNDLLQGNFDAFDVNCSSHNSQATLDRETGAIVWMRGPYIAGLECQTNQGKKFFLFDFVGTQEGDDERYPFSP
jgi:hypothetical protein